MSRYSHLIFSDSELKYGSGNLVTSGKISDLLPGFDPKGFDAMMTIKEGQMRGFTFAFYKSNERSGWTPTGYTRIKHVNEFKKKAVNVFPKDGFDAVLHNRDLTNPMMIGMRGKMVRKLQFIFKEYIVSQ